MKKSRRLEVFQRAGVLNTLKSRLCFGFLLLALMSFSGCRGCSAEKQGSVWKAIDVGESGGTGAGAEKKESDTISSSRLAPESPVLKAPSAQEFRFDFSPKSLRVYRATDVTFWVTNIPSGERPTKVVWRFDDDLTAMEGEEVKYRFEGGLRDRNVTATLHYPSGREERLVRTVPLDKIPKNETKKKRVAKSVPGIEEYPNGLRAVFVGSLRSGLELREQVRRILELEPHILFVMGDLGQPSADGGWSGIMRDLIEPARSRGVWVLPILGRSDLRKGRREQLRAFWEEYRSTSDFLAGSDFPENYAFRRDGVLFATLKTNHRDSDAEILRIQSLLGRAQGDPSRVVLSYLPLAPLTEKDDGHLEKAYRFYEVMERSGVAALVSAHYGITYLGQYGGLKTFSAGRVSDDCDLLPTGQCTPEAAVVLDFSKGKLKRVFTVALNDPLSIYDTQDLPAVLFNYRRWDPKVR